MLKKGNPYLFDYQFFPYIKNRSNLIIIILYCGISIFFFSASIAQEISTVAKSLKDIADNTKGRINTRLPVTSNDEIGELIREKGHEYGTVTHRPSRTGYLDLVALRYSILVNGITSICLTLLDVLTGFDEVKICVAYECDNQVINTLPASDDVLHNCKPIYKTLKGKILCKKQ